MVVAIAAKWGWMHASRTFLTLGLIGLLLAVIFLLLHIYVTQARNATLMLVVVSCAGAGGCRSMDGSKLGWVQVGANRIKWVQVGASRIR